MLFQQLRKIPGAGQERYRLLVSDGQYTSSFAMLATQLNEKVAAGEIEPFCIIKLDRFICNTVQNGKKVCFFFTWIDYLNTNSCLLYLFNISLQFKADIL